MESKNNYLIIKNYIDTLYKNDKRREVLELKEELKEHLILSAEEFIASGYSVEEAEQKSIEKFDGGREMLDELHKTLKKNKSKSYILCKVFRNITITSLMVVVLLFGYVYMEEKYYIDFDAKFYKDFKVLASKHDMTKVEEFKNDLRLLLSKKDYERVKNLEIFVSKFEEGNNNLEGGLKNSKLVYEIVDPKLAQISSQVCVGSKGVLDKNGNGAYPQIYIGSKILSFIYDYMKYIIYIPFITFIMYCIFKCIFKIKSIIYKRKYVNNI